MPRGWHTLEELPNDGLREEHYTCVLEAIRQVYSRLSHADPRSRGWCYKPIVSDAPIASKLSDSQNSGSNSCKRHTLVNTISHDVNALTRLKESSGYTVQCIKRL